MELHNLNLHNAILIPNNYKILDEPPNNLNLNDIVICYFDGLVYKIIPFNIINSFPLLYDTYFDSHNLSFDITIAVCPFTLASSAFKGKFTPTEFVNNSCLVITNNIVTFPIIDPTKFKKNKNNTDYNKKIKRFQVSIKTLRNAFAEYQDCKYIMVQKNKIKPIINPKYYQNYEIPYNHVHSQNNIHPKTLVYLIQYKSSKNHTTKNTIIIGKNATHNKTTGYNIAESGIHKYFENHEDKIIQKFGYIIPLLWFSWNSFFPNSKIIYLPSIKK